MLPSLLNLETPINWREKERRKGDWRIENRKKKVLQQGKKEEEEEEEKVKKKEFLFYFSLSPSLSLWSACCNRELHFCFFSPTTRQHQAN